MEIPAQFTQSADAEWYLQVAHNGDPPPEGPGWVVATVFGDFDVGGAVTGFGPGQPRLCVVWSREAPSATPEDIDNWESVDEGRVYYLNGDQAVAADASSPAAWLGKAVGVATEAGLQVSGSVRIPDSEVSGSPALYDLLWVGNGQASTTRPTSSGHGRRVLGMVTGLPTDAVDVLLAPTNATEVVP